MSHSIKLFNEISLSNKLFILITHSNSTNTKIRIRKTEILTKGSDNFGYKLDFNKKLVALEDHYNLQKANENKKALKNFLTNVNQFELKSKIKVEELQKSTKLNRSRLITPKVVLVKS